MIETCPGVVHDRGRDAPRAPRADQGPVLGRRARRAAVLAGHREPARAAARALHRARHRAAPPGQHGQRGTLQRQDRRAGALQHRELQVRPARGQSPTFIKHAARSEIGPTHGRTNLYLQITNRQCFQINNIQGKQNITF